jgi:hypothetical protein
MQSVKTIFLASATLSFLLVTAVQPASARHYDPPPLQHVRNPLVHHEVHPHLHSGLYVRRSPYRTHPTPYRTHPIAHRPR